MSLAELNMNILRVDKSVKQSIQSRMERSPVIRVSDFVQLDTSENKGVSKCVHMCC